MRNNLIIAIYQTEIHVIVICNELSSIKKEK